MTLSGTPIPTRGPIMPLMALGALAFGVIVWFVPIPRPRPKPVQPIEAPAPVAVEETPKTPESDLPLEDWTTLAGAFDSLIERAPQVAVTEGAAPTETIAPPPVVPTTPPVPWRYRGSITGPGGVAALVAGPRSQFFVFVGQVVIDETNPTGPSITVLEITPEYILVKRGDKEEQINYEEPQPTTSLVQRMSSAAGSSAVETAQVPGGPRGLPNSPRGSKRPR